MSNFIAGVDPGLASGGLVILDQEPQVIMAASMVEKAKGKAVSVDTANKLVSDLGGWSDKEFITAELRARAWVDAFSIIVDDFVLEHGPIDLWAVESFVDQRSRAREEKEQLLRNRWHTPLVMGLLIPVFEKHGATTANGKLVYQNAGIVIRQMSLEIATLKNRTRANKKDVVVRGDTVIRNDHQRKAFAHAYALSIRAKAKK